MVQGLDADMVRQHYARISDQELIHIATEDAAGITQEARAIALAEIRKRNLPLVLYQGIDAQNRDYTSVEIDSMCAILQELACPACKKITEPLNGTFITETISLLLFTNVHRKIVVACPQCLDKEMNKANIKTALLGWWSIPWGIIRTIQTLISNAKFRKAHHTHFPNNALQHYARSSAGKIMVFKGDKQQLSQMIGWESKQ